MIHVRHELREEFPREARFIEQLTRTNHHFRLLVTRYDEVNQSIHHIESEELPTTDEVLERLKKQRLKLKDEIAANLKRFENRM
jgi:uncharacterized protein